MIVLDALAILEAATLECKKRDINTPAVRDVLSLLEPHIRPEWLIPQFRFNVLDGYAGNDADGEAQQQALRVAFPGYPRLSQRANRKSNGCTSEEVPREP
jgi:hypothetical protein